MIQMQSVLEVADNSGAKRLNTILTKVLAEYEARHGVLKTDESR